ncbi:MAG TPA: hypothetical protein VM677_27875 [Actinokineospora sp.]|nr:hypothetical protein [Actinokineospora sp.]
MDDNTARTFTARWDALVSDALDPKGSAWWVASAESIVEAARVFTAEVMAAEGHPVTEWWGDVHVGWEPVGDEYGSDSSDHPAHERYAEVAVTVFEAMRAADPGDAIVLEVSLCSDRRSMRVSFASEAQAVTYIERHSSTRAFHDWNPDAPTVDPERHPRLSDLLYPTCDHGLSASNCYGPGHYPPDWS